MLIQFFVLSIDSVLVCERSEVTYSFNNPL